MKPIHRVVRKHLSERLHLATKPKCIVSAGVAIAGLCQVAGLHEAALGVSILTNLVWIWE